MCKILPYEFEFRLLVSFFCSKEETQEEPNMGISSIPFFARRGWLRATTHFCISTLRSLMMAKLDSLSLYIYILYSYLPWVVSGPNVANRLTYLRDTERIWNTELSSGICYDGGKHRSILYHYVYMGNMYPSMEKASLNLDIRKATTSLCRKISSYI